MKKLITFVFLIAAITANAQTKIVSKALGDSITIQNGTFEIKPVIATALGDTARSMKWVTSQMSRDTTVGFNLTVFLFDKRGAQLSQFGMNLPPLTGVQNYLNKIDYFIMLVNPRFSKP